VIGVGVFANACSIVQAGCIIGNGCTVDSGSIIEHDNEFGECSFIGPNASTTGNVKIGSNTFLGACSCVINGVCIGENTIIAAGSAVTSNIPSNVMAAGCPAKVKKQLAS
jgi:acetyltransferase-like isoleucine patch superfamily enzyme